MPNFFKSIFDSDEDINIEEKNEEVGYTNNNDMLSDLFYRNVPVYEKWRFVCRGGGFEQEITSERDKELALKVVTNGMCAKSDIVHLTVENDFSCGIAFTGDSVCVGGSLGRYNISYNDIHVAEDTPYGLVITKNNGHEIRLEAVNNETIVFLYGFSRFLNIVKDLS